MLRSTRPAAATSATESVTCAITQACCTRPRPPAVRGDALFRAAPGSVAALRETTDQIVHEMNPLLGMALYYAQKELTNFDRSRTKQKLDQLVAITEAFDSWGRAASAPDVSEFDVAKHIEEIADEIKSASGRRFEFAGPSPLLDIADPVLFRLAFRNGVVNAAEASQGLTEEPVVITWDKDDRDVWVSILDRGAGLPDRMEKAFEIGASTKGGHAGMGLTIAKRAAKSLHGDIRLVSRPEGGARFELRWPRAWQP